MQIEKKQKQRDGEEEPKHSRCFIALPSTPRLAALLWPWQTARLRRWVTERRVRSGKGMGAGRESAGALGGWRAGDIGAMANYLASLQPAPSRQPSAAPFPQCHLILRSLSNLPPFLYPYLYRDCTSRSNGEYIHK